MTRSGALGQGQMIAGVSVCAPRIASGRRPILVMGAALKASSGLAMRRLCATKTMPIYGA